MQLTWCFKELPQLVLLKCRLKGFIRLILMYMGAFNRSDFQKFSLTKDCAAFLIRTSLLNTQPNLWNLKRKPKPWLHVWKARSCVCVITRRCCLNQHCSFMIRGKVTFDWKWLCLSVNRGSQDILLQSINCVIRCGLLCCDYFIKIYLAACS